MFFLASILQNAIIKIPNGLMVGKVSFLAIDPSQGKLVGLVFTRGLFVKQAFVIAPKNIMNAGDGIIMISSPEAVDPINEIIRVRDVFQAKIDFFGMPTISESGQFIGHCKDLLVDKESFFIHRFYIQSGQSERIFSRDDVIGVTNKKLIVKDGALKQKVEDQKPLPSLNPAPALA